MNPQTLSRVPFVSALAVGATERDQLELEKIFRECGWTLGRARTRSEAHRFMDTTPVRVVISERELPEGGWREMLDDLMGRPEPPPLLVTSRLADDSLWAEVLNMGGYDVLAQPLDGEEVTRVVSAAARHWITSTSAASPRFPDPYFWPPPVNPPPVPSYIIQKHP
jgi:DNA-binding response OmpR family regulator